MFGFKLKKENEELKRKLVEAELEKKKIAEETSKLFDEILTVFFDKLYGKYNTSVDIKKYSPYVIDIFKNFEEKIKKFDHDLLETKRYAQYLRKLPTPVIITDTDFNIKFINIAAEKFLGGDFSKFLDKKCYNILKTEHCNTPKCRLQKTVNDGKIHVGDNVALNTPVRYYTSPIKDTGGKIVGIIIFLLDISLEVAITHEINELANKISNGDFNSRISEANFRGNGLSIVKNVNKLVDSFTIPFEQIKKIIQELSVGKISSIIEKNYSGEFDKLFKSVNLLIDTSKNIVHIVNEISEGNLNINIEKRSEDDYLLIALEKMIIRLKRVIFDIKSAVNDIASGSRQISSASEQLSQGASEQASNLEQISSSVEEITSNIKQTATNALSTENIANDVAQKVEQIGSVITETVDTIKNISSKISMIDEIARQTNLLALNAAIEAARVGEAGKGFAVVASEVKKLAERSGKYASEIIEFAEKCVLITEKAKDSVMGIIPEVKKTAELVQEIASANNEQALGIEQINDAIQQLDQIVNENAAMAEELSSSAVEFSSQTSLLKDSLKYFHTDIDELKVKKLEGEVNENFFPMLNNDLKENNQKRVVLDLSKDDSDDEFERF